jgi:hypothetical protein
MFSGEPGVYPGGTTRPELRPKEHRAALTNKRHWNVNFQVAVNEHGIESFSYTQYGPLPYDQIAAKEQALLDEAKKAGVNIFNKQLKATKPHPVGYKLSEKTRRKQSRAKKGNTNAAKHFIFVSPEGILHETNCLSDFCEKHRLDISCMSRLNKGKQSNHRGWRRV